MKIIIISLFLLYASPSFALFNPPTADQFGVYSISETMLTSMEALKLTFNNIFDDLKLSFEESTFSSILNGMTSVYTITGNSIIYFSFGSFGSQTFDFAEWDPNIFFILHGLIGVASTFTAIRIVVRG